MLGADARRVPPSRNTLTLSPNDSRAASSVVAAASPERFALVAVIGRPRPSLNARAIGCGETRTPTPPSGPISCARKTVARGKHDRQRSRPECDRETSRDVEISLAIANAIGAVGGDQRDRFLRIASLDREKFCQRRRRKRIGGDSVKSFGRINHQLASAQRGDRIVESGDFNWLARTWMLQRFPARKASALPAMSRRNCLPSNSIISAA